MLYTIVSSDQEYRGMTWDKEQIAKIVGSYGQAIDKRIDINNTPRSYESIFTTPLNVQFPILHKSDENKKIPEIAEVQGRLFLTPRAYKALHPMICHDGEFIPIIYENGEAYFFTPMRVAEDANALDTALSKKNQWGDLENLAFDEQKILEWRVFRAKFNHYQTLQCNNEIKNTIEKAGLTGVYITPDLGRIFPCEKSSAEKYD